MKRYLKLSLLALFGAAAAATPAAALVRLGVGASSGFALPLASFDNAAKSSPQGSVRFYGNLFHWLTAEIGADFHLSHGAESDSGIGETHLYSYKAGLAYKLDMGVFKPYVEGGWAQFNERIKREYRWEDITAQGFFVGPGLEYYFSERFAALGAFCYHHSFDDAWASGRDTQYLKLDFGLTYYFW